MQLKENIFRIKISVLDLRVNHRDMSLYFAIIKKKIATE